MFIAYTSGQLRFRQEVRKQIVFSLGGASRELSDLGRTLATEP